VLDLGDVIGFAEVYRYKLLEYIAAVCNEFEAGYAFKLALIVEYVPMPAYVKPFDEFAVEILVIKKGFIVNSATELVIPFGPKALIVTEEIILVENADA
jgi:hypothetical protein